MTNAPLEKLKQLVNESNQATVARLLGISEALMSRILKGDRRLSAKVAARLGFRATWELLPGPEGSDRPILMTVEKEDRHA